MHILYNKLLNNAIYLVVYTVPEHGYVADYTYLAIIKGSVTYLYHCM